MLRERPWLGASLIGLAAGVVLIQYWLEARRPAPIEERADVEFTVSSSQDSGPGSLREALFEAARAPKRPRIVIKTARVEIASPLPPIVHPEGVVLEAATQAILDADPLPKGTVLEIRAPSSVLRNLSVQNAHDVGIAVIADDLVVDSVSVENSDVGLAVVGDSQRLEIRRCSFRANRLGVQLASRAAGSVIRESLFERHLDSAVWAVQPRSATSVGQSPVRIVDNKFHGGRYGLVIANFPAVIERNEFVGLTDTAVALLGGTVHLTANRIRGTRRVGVFADVTEHAVIADNEIDDNKAIGVFVRSSAGTLVARNRLSRNGYGIVTVFGHDASPPVVADNLISAQKVDGLVIIGASPIVRRNRSFNNSGAGIRVLDFVAPGQRRLVAAPFLEHNVIAGNAVDEPPHGDYAEGT